MITFLQVVPGLIYLSAQVIAIKGTFNSIFELDPDEVYPVIIIMFLILSFEWAGGLSSVALTDTIQAVVMVLSFIIIPSVIKRSFGGWPEIDLETFPKPEFYQTFSKEQQWNFWQLSVINFSFFTLPHLLQRCYAAKDLKALKAGYTIMTVGPWFVRKISAYYCEFSTLSCLTFFPFARRLLLEFSWEPLASRSLEMEPAHRIHSLPFSKKL